jgi:hypothetical protein
MLHEEPPDDLGGIKPAEQVRFRPFVTPTRETVEHHFRVCTAAGPRLPLYATLIDEPALRFEVTPIRVNPESY